MQLLFFGVIGTSEQRGGGLHLLNRKTVAEAFWNAELEAELRQMAWIHCPFQGSKSREMHMQKIDQVRASTVYPHDICSEECRRRGKPILVTT